ncbi:hypothetical protein EV201_1083 [Ancylomarina subtilis]|uniref:Uncharacterized protein n=1 Tax=Ancylomarina subtilis TaxID=1639035 RepID=A0A4V6MEK0_9BACT|nr:hypothetical protein [Ancylomarina subtilis]RZT96445.1 hypothetical protein EV201_1083 [Ancylomarina subtilis]
MKTALLNQLFIFLTFISAGPIVGSAQTTYTPGPANLDTSKFAHIYFFRDKVDEFPDNWLSVIINDDRGFCVKAKMNHIYRVNTVLTGDTRFQTNINNEKIEILLKLYPGKNYYVELKPEKKGDKRIVGRMKILDETEGIERIQAFHNTVQDRYCILPFTGNNDFRENAWNDTIRWFASDQYDYSFMPLPSWELILRSTYRTAFTFRNKLISNTYSEGGGILYQQLKKCRSEIEFENYCRDKFIKSTLDKRRDSLISWEIKPLTIPYGIKYAKIVNIENRSIADNLSNGKPLLIRSTYVVFFWTDQKGKGNTACLYTSERGLPNELQAISILEERILWSWKSFMLVKK